MINNTLLIFYLVIFQFYCSFSIENSELLTKEEAELIGIKFQEPKIVKDFIKYLGHKKINTELKNDFIYHHEIIMNYFSSKSNKKKRRFSFSKYYDLLDYVRKPFVKLFDPGMEVGRNVYEIFKRNDSFNSETKTRKCKVIKGAPSKSTFMSHIKSSTPVIFKGAVKAWPALNWTIDDLVHTFGDTNVVVR